jgi:NAD(P)-dependent dehydrogenase (short-subunit alcohol dehydrogenase family)
VVALELANDGVTCNAICPGWVDTPLVERVGAENPDMACDQRTRGQPSDLTVTAIARAVMISRCGVPTRVPDARPALGREQILAES